MLSTFSVNQVNYTLSSSCLRCMKRTNIYLLGFRHLTSRRIVDTSVTLGVLHPQRNLYSNYSGTIVSDITVANDRSTRSNILRSFSHRCFSSSSTCRLTWKEHSEAIKKSIRDADFVAVDVEYTGLHIKDDRFIGIEKCYEAHASGAKQFIPCQIGITSAKYLSDGKWRITPASVYTMPAANKFFKVSTTTLQFLKDNNFDFNTWIHYGVEHLTPSEERERKFSIEQRIAELNNMTSNDCQAPSAQPVPFDLSTLTPEDRHVAEKTIDKINQWMCGSNNDPLEIEMENAFQRLLMHTIIGQQFPQVYSHSTRRGDEKVICIYKSKGELYTEQRAMLEAELAKVEQDIGVRSLLDEIARNNKVVVGHNCFYDLLHIYQTFYDELPNSAEEFKRRWTERFQNTLDTKYISEFHDAVAAPHYSSTLKGLFDYMCHVESANAKRLSFEVQPLHGTSWQLPSAFLPLLASQNSAKENKDVDCEGDIPCKTLEQSHDAGYDSFMTCIVFIIQVNRILGTKYLNWDKIATKEQGGGIQSNLLLDTIGSVNNCIRLVKSQPNSINLSSNGEGDMARYFFMRGYPNSWKKWDIMKVWSPLWVSVSVIDETSCWIIVKNDEDIRNINLIYRMMKNPQFTLQTYEQSNARLNVE